MRILFAEDDRDLARAVKALLEHSGYSVDVVCNGRDAPKLPSMAAEVSAAANF